MFEKFHFTNKQVEKYYDAAKRDLEIARSSEHSEVGYRFCYDAIVKLAITVCAANGQRVKSRRGHHIALVTKLAELLNDKEIEGIGDDMRKKRNHDFYDGGRIFSDKETKGYLKWAGKVFEKADGYLNDKLNKLL